MVGPWEPRTWLEAFSTSTAFAGLMAALAAGIALWGVNRRIEADKKIARKLRRAERATAELMRDAVIEDRDFEAWWAEYHRLKSELDDMPPEDAFEVLDALGRTAPSLVATALVGIALRTYAPSEAEETS